MKSAYTIAVFSIIGGLLVHLMVLFVIEIDVPTRPERELDPFAVSFIGNLNEEAPPSVYEQAALKDSAPLFMPTKWNSVSSMSDVASLQSATEIFEPFDPQLTIVDAKPTAPMDGHSRVEFHTSRLPEGPAFFLSRYGREPPQQVGVESAGPSYAVQQISGFRFAAGFKQTLTSTIRSAAPGALWNPVKLFLQVKEGVPVGLPLVSQSSGFADWDTSLQAYFTQMEFYTRLKDGYYQIWVYP